MLHSNVKALASCTPPPRNVSNRHRKHGKGNMKTSDGVTAKETTQEAADQPKEEQ